ncbi:MAG: hypothetical protein PHH01_00640 [Patescibacteria group bacterium]|nr:hypothetical protein [Patescibacteria group bacterium]
MSLEKGNFSQEDGERRATDTAGSNQQEGTERSFTQQCDDLNNELALLDIGHNGFFQRVSGGLRRIQSGEARHPEITLDNIKTELGLLKPANPDEETGRAKALELISNIQGALAEQKK